VGLVTGRREIWGNSVDVFLHPLEEADRENISEANWVDVFCWVSFSRSFMLLLLLPR
jgi:hypothetical protein